LRKREEDMAILLNNPAKNVADITTET